MDGQLRESLEQLREEIEHLDASDTGSKDKLHNLVSDLELKLDQPNDAEHHATLLKNLKDAVEHFKADHPRATGVLNHITATLSNMGF